MTDQPTRHSEPMAGTLTRRQREILLWIERYYHHHERPPTLEEIARSFDVHASTVHEHVHAIRDAGYLREAAANESGAIIPTLTFCPTCGQPLGAKSSLL